jgi:hypothetical protein
MISVEMHGTGTPSLTLPLEGEGIRWVPPNKTVSPLPACGGRVREGGCGKRTFVSRA